MSRMKTVFGLGLVIALAAIGVVVFNITQDGSGSPAANCAPSGEQRDLGGAKLIVEYNFTDGDVGVHGLIDDDGWSEMCIEDPTGSQILAVRPLDQLGRLNIATVFFESREPPLDEFGIAELADQFPEGIYQFTGIGYDGVTVTGRATFTHDIPSPPQILSPDLAEDEETAGSAMVPLGELLVSWDPVTDTVAGDSADITGYEVILTNVDHEDEDGFSRPMYDVHVGPDATSLIVPATFMEADTLYELEVLALESSGNQTISVGFFITEA